MGFGVVRGGLSGFTVYFSGDFAGAGVVQAARAPSTRASVRVFERAGLGADVAPAPCAAAPCAAPPPPAVGRSASVCVHAAAHASAPTSAAPARRRGCRAGRRKQRAHVDNADTRERPATPRASALHVDVEMRRSPPQPPPPPPTTPSAPLPLPSSLSASAPTFVPVRQGGSVECGPQAPKVSGRRERVRREREQYGRELRYEQERYCNVRARSRERASRSQGRPRSPQCPQVHVPLGVCPRTLGGLDRYEKRRTQHYRREARAQGFVVSSGEESSDGGGSD